jgi:hypothetical protein
VKQEKEYQDLKTKAKTIYKQKVDFKNNTYYFPDNFCVFWIKLKSPKKKQPPPPKQYKNGPQVFSSKYTKKPRKNTKKSSNNTKIPVLYFLRGPEYF